MIGDEFAGKHRFVDEEGREFEPQIRRGFGDPVEEWEVVKTTVVRGWVSNDPDDPCEPEYAVFTHTVRKVEV